MSALCYENVGGLDVTVDDAFGVGDVKGIGNLNRKVEHNRERKRLAMDMLAQGFAVDELHGDERPLVLLANVVDRADAGMGESGSGVGFPAKTFQRLRVLHHVVGQKFQGDGAVEAGIQGFVDHTHSTGTELFDDAKVRDGLADHS